VALLLSLPPLACCRCCCRRCCPSQVLLRLLKQVTANSLGIEVDKPTLDYVAQLITLLFNSQSQREADWQDAIVPYLTPFFGDEGAEGVSSACFSR